MTSDFPDINAGVWYLTSQPGGRWEVCEPTTGDVYAEVIVDPASGELTSSGDEQAASAGVAAVRRFLSQANP